MCGCSSPGRVAIFNNSVNNITILSGSTGKRAIPKKIVYFNALKSSDGRKKFEITIGSGSLIYKFPQENLFKYSNLKSGDVYLQFEQDGYLYLAENRDIEPSIVYPLTTKYLSKQPHGFPLKPILSKKANQPQ